MKKLYSYEVVCKTDGKVDAVANTRESARQFKRDFEQTYSDKYKIVQNVFVLSETKEVQ